MYITTYTVRAVPTQTHIPSNPMYVGLLCVCSAVWRWCLFPQSSMCLVLTPNPQSFECLVVSKVIWELGCDGVLFHSHLSVCCWRYCFHNHLSVWFWCHFSTLIYVFGSNVVFPESSMCMVLATNSTVIFTEQVEQQNKSIWVKRMLHLHLNYTWVSYCAQRIKFVISGMLTSEDKHYACVVFYVDNITVCCRFSLGFHIPVTILLRYFFLITQLTKPLSNSNVRNIHNTAETKTQHTTSIRHTRSLAFL